MVRFLSKLISVAVCCSPCHGEQALDTAIEQLVRNGRYEEAIEALSDAPPSSASVLGQARCLVALGRTAEAIEKLRSPKVGGDPRIHAYLAELHFGKGNLAAASNSVAAALSKTKDQRQALFIQAELLRVRGQIDEAAVAYKRIAYLPNNQELDVHELLWVGRAMAQHARWNRVPQMYDQLVNSFYPDLLKQNKDFWPAHWEAGKLFLEKYNDADASRELNAALAINPRAAAVHVELGRLALQNFELTQAIESAERALRIDADNLDALLLAADIAFTNLQPSNAMEPLRLAREQNPLDERVLGRSLALYLRLDGLQSDLDEKSRCAQLIAEVSQRNRHCGRFFETAAESFEAMRIYPMADQFYQRAITRLPQLVSARGQRGLVQMRLGAETDARQTLEEAFSIDPFNVRVKNTLDVLDLLNTYAVLETEHFVIRFDRINDGLLAEYAARLLENQVYPEIVAALGYEPPEKTLLEIFSRANGTSGHSWFSARMVGLPFIGTVGACAGKMIALTSPADGKAYNWARVLRHEFVHVVNLQQTGFLVPHWFTEALAVRNERGGYPAQWDHILAKYAAAEKLFDLETINHGFVRPGTSERWTLAYFQAYLYADLIVKLGGEDALAEMLRHYAAGKTTEQTVKSVLGRSLADFEKEYRDYIRTRSSRMGRSQLSDIRSADELKKLIAAEPDNPNLLAELGAAFWQSGNTRQARVLAQRSIRIQPQQPLANYVLAQLMFSVGEDKKAWERIVAGLDQATPDAKLLALAAQLKFDARQYEDAAAYYQLGQESFPYDLAWTKGLARVFLAQQNRDRLAVVLARIAEREADETLIARKLTQLALDKRDYSEAEAWANRILHVNVTDPIAHAELAEALAGQGKMEEAIRELDTALKLSPAEPSWKQRLQELKKAAE